MGTDSCVACELLCNGWRFEQKDKNCPSLRPVCCKSCIPLHPVLKSRKCCCLLCTMLFLCQVIFSGCVDMYVSGRVNRNVSIAVPVNGQGTLMPNGYKAVEPTHIERITVV